MQRQIFNSDRGLHGNLASRFGAVLAMTGLLLLSACGSSKDVTQNNLPEPGGMDGVPPALTVVSIRESTKSARPNGTVQPGKSARVDITASEAIMAPVIIINGVEAEVIGKATGWYGIREMTDADALGEVNFTVDIQDISGEVGAPASATTDGSALVLCDEDCPEPIDLSGDWRLDVEGGAGVGPAPGDTQWWNTDIDGVVELRACWFDDVYRFGPDGSFANILGDETWLEPWQGVEGESCGAPVAPHDGSTAGTWAYNESTNKLTISGTGLHIGLPRTVNGGDLPGVPVPDSIVYDVLTLENDSMTIAIETSAGTWWTYRLVRQPRSPLAGKWRLDTTSGAGVGPAPGDIQWWSTDIEGVVELRDCWFDDVYVFGDDGSFRNVLGDETWLEAWQGVAGETCGAPIAPHDGSNGAIYQYDEEAGTVKLTGVGAHIGLPRTMNGGDLTAPGDAPESVTYDVLTFDGDNMQIAVDVGYGWWTYRLVRTSNSPVVGKWKLATEGGAGVGPAAGDTQWWNTDIEGVVELRACWFDDVAHFGGDGSFRNYQGDETWLEAWQGVAGESCGAPVAPHDGSTVGVWQYDDAASTLTISGVGAHIGLPKAVNGGQLPDVPVPESVTYDVIALDGDTMTVAIDVGDGIWWTFKYERVNDTVALAGKWRLNTDSGAGVGPAAGDIQWWSTNIEGIVELRDCWFDDYVEFGADGLFENVQGDETFLEPWQIGSETCGAPIAPHDGSARAIFEYDEAANKLTVHGKGAHLGLPRTVNGGDLTIPADAPDSVTYDVLTLDGDNITVAIDVGYGWWTYRYVRVSNSPYVGNWKLDVNGGAGVGPAAGDTQWWNTDIEGVVELRACWFDDVFHFGGGGGFQNFQDGETWLEPWQVGSETCGAPLAPHDGSTAGSWRNDDAASTLTISGTGSHLGLPKAVNGGQLPDVPVPESVTYDIISFDLGTLEVAIDVGDGIWWTFKFARE